MLPRSLLPFPELSPSGSQHRLTGTWHAAKESYLIFAKHWNKFTLAIRKRILPTSCTMWCFGKWSLATESPRGKNAMQVSLHWQNMLWLHCIQNCPSVVAFFQSLHAAIHCLSVFWHVCTFRTWSNKMLLHKHCTGSLNHSMFFSFSTMTSQCIKISGSGMQLSCLCPQSSSKPSSLHLEHAHADLEEHWKHLASGTWQVKSDTVNGHNKLKKSQGK